MEMSVPLSVSITLPKSKSKPWTLLWKIQTCSDKISPNWRKHVKTSRIRQTKANAKSTVKPTQYNPNEVSQNPKIKKTYTSLKLRWNPFTGKSFQNSTRCTNTPPQLPTILTHFHKYTNIRKHYATSCKVPINFNVKWFRVPNTNTIEINIATTPCHHMSPWY
jgi:hypothetical protein